MADDPRATHESPPPDLRFGAAVVSDGGRHGVISDLVPDVPGVPGGVRVTWDDGTIALVPRDAIAIEGERIVVHTGDTDDVRRPAHTTEPSENRSAAATTGDAPALRADEGLVVPIIEERIAATATWREAGAVTFRVRTAEERQTVTAHPAREELDVEEVAVGRELAAGERVEVRTEGDTTIIPVIAEEPVMVMRRTLVKELRVTRRTVQVEQTVNATVRRQRVEVDAGDLAGRVRADGTEPATRGTDAEGTAHRRRSATGEAGPDGQ